jgi:hypothetical protein
VLRGDDSWEQWVLLQQRLMSHEGLELLQSFPPITIQQPLSESVCVSTALQTSRDQYAEVGLEASMDQHAGQVEASSRERHGAKEEDELSRKRLTLGDNEMESASHRHGSLLQEQQHEAPSALSSATSTSSSATSTSSSATSTSIQTSYHQPEQPGVRLVMTPDAIKDQTYFLAHLSKKQLQKVMFPLGPLNKSQVPKGLRATKMVPCVKAVRVYYS